MVSDIDDTLMSSGGHFPAGCDARLPKHCVYPGAVAFLNELDTGHVLRIQASNLRLLRPATVARCVWLWCSSLLKYPWGIHQGLLRLQLCRRAAARAHFVPPSPDGPGPAAAHAVRPPATTLTRPASAASSPTPKPDSGSGLSRVSPQAPVSAFVEGASGAGFGGGARRGVPDQAIGFLGPRGSAASSSGGSWAGGVGGGGGAPTLARSSRVVASSASAGAPGRNASREGGGPAEGLRLEDGVALGEVEDAAAPSIMADGGPLPDADSAMADDGEAVAIAAHRSASSGTARSLELPEGRIPTEVPRESPSMDRSAHVGRPPLGRPPSSPRRSAQAGNVPPPDGGAAGHVSDPEPAAIGSVAAPAGASLADAGEWVPPVAQEGPGGAPTWLAPPGSEPGSPGGTGAVNPVTRSSSRGRGLQRVAIAEGAASLGDRGELARGGAQLSSNPSPSWAGPAPAGGGVGLADWGPSASLDSSQVLSRAHYVCYLNLKFSCCWLL